MSAVIHAFPTTEHRPDVDDLVDELGRVLGDEHRTIGTPAGPQRLVTIRPDEHRNGANDLVVTGTTSPGLRWLLVAAAAVAAALVLALAAGMGGANADAPAVVGDSIVVQPGDTLWDLAADVTPVGGDVRATVAQIRDLNELGGATLRAGSVVVLPDPGA